MVKQICLWFSHNHVQTPCFEKLSPHMAAIVQGMAGGGCRAAKLHVSSCLAAVGGGSSISQPCHAMARHCLQSSCKRHWSGGQSPLADSNSLCLAVSCMQAPWILLSVI